MGLASKSCELDAKSLEARDWGWGGAGLVLWGNHGKPAMKSREQAANLARSAARLGGGLVGSVWGAGTANSLKSANQALEVLWGKLPKSCALAATGSKSAAEAWGRLFVGLAPKSGEHASGSRFVTTEYWAQSQILK